MKFLAFEVENYPVNWAEVPSDLLSAEARQIYDLQQAGLIRQIHFRADTHSAVIDWESDSIEKIVELTANFPLVEAGLIHFEIIPLIPYSGFSRLFL
ncbi:MAG TPA: hypothetical protein VF338_03625 [Leptolinea sp.]